MNVTIDPLNFTERFKLMAWGNRTYNWSSALKNAPTITNRDSIIIAFYSLIILISIFGNLLVCNIVARSAKMRSSTYVFIANLALSDFMMTVLNIPFNVARILLNDWPFGSFMCSFVPLVQVTSVYVSTFTMTCIAVDRYRIISKPLEPRLRSAQAIKIISCVWVLAILLSLPHAIFNKVESVFTYRRLVRCRTVYPINMSKWITLIAVITQYILPLSITGVLYYLIIVQVWSRNSLGVVTEGQRVSQAKAKKKTIKMLVVVVILFALCWFPLNTFNLLREFIPKAFMQKSVTHSTVFFICHWLAMSSVCYNPFIYCWLNDHFRSGALSCLLCIKNAGRQLNDSFKSTKLSRLSSVPTTVTVDYGFNSSQDANNDSCCSNAVQMTSKRSSLDRSRSFRHSYEFDIPLKSLPSKTTQASLKRCSASKSNVKVSTTLVGGELQSTNFTISEEAC
ncbi:G-protein coupled receptor 83-like [Argiope bruennichi]|uniref:Putative G-protein coupled receptor 83 like protein n=1 Tax=Argiope bruennichi TaxID=94029 RepID=A0A8T0FPM1_ARGBR|nr:G-protein coupled receptor 83-like [Argiope bruennichi]KAF8792108.1 putative G-protein coupled receptor 83 like protein [Argiope bruennichi]